MSTINVSVTQSIEIQPSNLTAGTPITYSIDNPLDNSSYFVLETVRNAEGYYDNTTPKNLEGTFTRDAGISTLVQDKYKAGIIILPGGGELVFTPANNIISTTLRLRGMGV
jgi:hypothetical protein